MIYLDSYSSMKKGNLKIVVDGGELARNINKKNKKNVMQANRCLWKLL